NVVCGLVVVFFGLHFAGVVKIPALQKTLRPNMDRPVRGPFSSFLFGVVFAIGWTPCVGAFLGSALSMAAASGSTVQGVILLVCYSLGLGVPFVISALLIDQLEGAFTWVKKHYQVINVVCGVLLVVVGVLMATGQLGRFLSLLSV
ncbi:MAG: sulfite exporter TauE/SafE family protein, partial [Eggerthellaceae bacterium]|nr:sulfite exporter TauE/SafE family protein [Eggerthellaceae bacterium]